MLVISVHIPKTGGSSFYRLLHNIFNDEYYADYDDIPIIGKNSAPTIIERDKHCYVKVDGSERLVNCVHGHFSAVKYDSVCDETLKLVWLRDPLQRAISHFNYWCRLPNPDHPVYQRVAAQGMNFEGFARDPAIQNLQRVFIGECDIDDFDFVGITEWYEAGIELLGKILGISGEMPEISETNVNPARRYPRAAYNVSDETYEWFRDLHERDYALVASARNRALELSETYGIRVTGA